MDKNHFIAGVCEKYDQRLLKNKLNIEGNVISVLWKDPLLLDDNESLTERDFYTKDGRLLFGIAKTLRSKGIGSFDEVAVNTYLDKDTLAKLDEVGGYSSVSKLVDIANLANAPQFIDDLYRSNLLMRLSDEGFNLFNPVKTDKGKDVVPFELFEKNHFTSNEITDWYDVRIAKMSRDGTQSKVLEEKSNGFEITDDVLKKFETGSAMGIDFSVGGKDIEGNDIGICRFLSSTLAGIHKSCTQAIVGYSSAGKTNLWCHIIMGLLFKGERVLICTNEQDSTPFYLNFITWLSYKYFRYYSLTKNKLQSGNLSDEDKAMLQKVKKYWNDNFAQNVFFVHISDADMTTVKKKCRYYILQKAVSCILYDTLKAEISDMGNQDSTWLSLIRDSRQLDAIAKRYGVAMMLSLQVSSSTKGRLWLDESVISQSKQVIEVFESCCYLRGAYREELDPNNSRVFIQPFRRVKENGVWVEQPFVPDPTANYRILFYGKNRNGISSETDQCALLYQFIGAQSVWKEVAYCRPTHGYIGAANGK